jgi:hypothetical protein
MLAPLRGKHANRRPARLSPRPRVSRNSTTRRVATCPPRSADASLTPRNQTDCPQFPQGESPAAIQEPGLVQARIEVR